MSLSSRPNWQDINFLRSHPEALHEIERLLQEGSQAETQQESVLDWGGVGGLLHPDFTCTPANNSPQGPPRAVIPNDPIPWSEATTWSGTRARLHKTYMNRGLPALPREGVDRERIEHAEGLEAASL